MAGDVKTIEVDDINHIEDSLYFLRGIAETAFQCFCTPQVNRADEKAATCMGFFLREAIEREVKAIEAVTERARGKGGGICENTKKTSTEAAGNMQF